MHGLHLTADLHDCRCAMDRLVDADALLSACTGAVDAVGLSAVAKLAHGFPSSAKGPGGVTVAVLLAESHVCIHTWPEQGGVTLDVYVCNFGADHSAKAVALMKALEALFMPRQVERHELVRGAGAAAAPLSARAQALILAAGRGERMRPLTDVCPKPLLEVRGKPLMQWTLEALARGGFGKIVVNTAWLGDRIADRFGVQPAGIAASTVVLSYSHEGQDFGGALETAGGIARALPSLDDVFWVVAGDVFAPEFAFTQAAMDRFRSSGKLAHLWLVPNPAHNPKGDFGIDDDGMATDESRNASATRYTFSTFALYRRELFEPPYSDIPFGNPQGMKAALAPLLRAAIAARQVSATLYTGPWTDVGTPERLTQLNGA